MMTRIKFIAAVMCFALNVHKNADFVKKITMFFAVF